MATICPHEKLQHAQKIIVSGLPLKDELCAMLLHLVETTHPVHVERSPASHNSDQRFRKNSINFSKKKRIEPQTTNSDVALRTS